MYLLSPLHAFKLHPVIAFSIIKFPVSLAFWRLMLRYIIKRHTCVSLQAFFTLFVMYYEATACNVEDDIAEVLHILVNVLNCCMKFRDHQGNSLSSLINRNCLPFYPSCFICLSTGNIAQFLMQYLCLTTAVSQFKLKLEGEFECLYLAIFARKHYNVNLD